MKPILDACCGSRMFHFDKQNPHVLFADNRTLKTEFKDGDKLRKLEVKPDIIHDFTDMPYNNNPYQCVRMKPCNGHRQDSNIYPQRLNCLFYPILFYNQVH